MPLLAALLVLLLLPAAAGAQIPVLDLRVGEPIGKRAKADGRMVLGDVRTRIGIERRGTDSDFFPKRSYALELRGDRGGERDLPLLGLPADDDWVLTAAYRDRTLLRNHIGYAAARHVGRWAPGTRFVEVVLDGRPQGLYVLTERIQLAAGRVRAPRGSAIVELSDRGRGDFRGPVTRRPYELVSPGDPGRALRARAARRIAAAERDPGRVGGAVEAVLLQELFGNVDGLRRSTYLVVPPSGPVRFGPVWDLDRGFGDAFFPGPQLTTGLVTRHHPYARVLLRRPAFRAALAERWRAWRAAGIREALIGALDEGAAAIAPAAERDHALWRQPAQRGFAEEVADVRAWIEHRVGWLDSNLGG
jgi:hypothetical protein